jgi:hypothetical protein
MGCSRSCAATAAPAQEQTEVPRQAELVICDQSIERTFSRLSYSCRLSKHYARRCDTSEALIYATMTRLMARRMARM